MTATLHCDLHHFESKGGDCRFAGMPKTEFENSFGCDYCADSENRLYGHPKVE